MTTFFPGAGIRENTSYKTSVRLEHIDGRQSQAGIWV